MKLPWLFQKESTGSPQFVVILGTYNFIKSLDPKDVFSMATCDAAHQMTFFQTEPEALEYIRKWWSAQ